MSEEDLLQAGAPAARNRISSVRLHLPDQLRATEFDPPGKFCKVSLTNPPTAREALDIVKKVLAIPAGGKEGSSLFIEKWNCNATYYSVKQQPKGNLRYLYMKQDCPVLIFKSPCGNSYKTEIVFCLDWETPKQAEILRFPVDTNSLARLEESTSKVSNDRPQMTYARVQVAEHLFTTVKHSGTSISRLLVNIDDHFVVGLPPDLEFMIVAYTEEEVLLAVLPAKEILEHIGKPISWALCFVVKNDDWKIGTGFVPDAHKTTHWTSCNYVPQWHKEVIKNVAYQPTDDLFNVVTREQIYADRYLLAASEFKSRQKKSKQFAKQQMKDVLAAIAAIELKEKPRISQEQVQQVAAQGAKTAQVPRSEIQKACIRVWEIWLAIKIPALIFEKQCLKLAGEGKIRTVRVRRNWFKILTNVIDTASNVSFVNRQLQVLQKRHQIHTWARLYLALRRQQKQHTEKLLKPCKELARYFAGSRKCYIEELKATQYNMQAAQFHLEMVTESYQGQLMTLKWELLFTKLVTKSKALTLREFGKEMRAVYRVRELKRQLTAEQQVPKCILCLEAFPDIVLMCPSKHQCLCTTCFESQIAAATNLCPLCRLEFRDHVKTFLA
jgi:hypothetical protein